MVSELIESWFENNKDDFIDLWEDSYINSSLRDFLERNNLSVKTVYSESGYDDEFSEVYRFQSLITNDEVFYKIRGYASSYVNATITEFKRVNPKIVQKVVYE